jgi:hypothetical protein
MPSAAQFNQVIGVLAKVESDPNVAEALSNADDGCTPFIGDGDPPAPTPISYVFDGNIGRAAGNLAPQRRTTPNGRHRMGQFQCLPKGLGSLYSAILLPPNEVHRWLQGSGYTATYSASPTPQWSYTPVAVGTVPSHLTVRYFMQGSQYDQFGVQSDFSYESAGLGTPIFSFNWKGIGLAPTDQALPVITYQATGVIPAVSSAVVHSVGGVTTMTLRKVSYSRNRGGETARIAQNLAGGHAGFIFGQYTPEWEIEVERPLRSAFDPEALMASATPIALSLTYNSATQYNRWTHSTAQGQIVDVQPGNDGGLATVTLKVRGFASTPSANDAELIVFN